jgi:hypothetical protein
MVSNLKRIINSVIGQKSQEIEKNVFRHQDFLTDLEKSVNDEVVKTKGEVMQKMRAKFSYHLSKNDYYEIEKQIGYVLK